MSTATSRQACVSRCVCVYTYVCECELNLNVFVSMFFFGFASCVTPAWHTCPG